LSALERSEQLLRRKQLHEAEFPQTKRGGDRQSEPAKEKLNAESAFSFSKDVSKKTGKSERVIQEDVQIATRIFYYNSTIVLP
jgi:pyruvate/2-oxoglutarate dehydrogenase complex dihydrolipoamide acyltransferase (E2) component